MDIKIIEQLLELEPPWRVSGVRVDAKDQVIIIQVECEQTRWVSADGALHIHSWEKRRWRHLDLWQYRTLIEARIPRLVDPESGKTQTLQVPWAERLSRWSKRFESHAIDVLLSTRSLKDASKLLCLGWDSCQALMKRAVERGLQGRELGCIEMVGIDEKSFRRGQDYISLMTDLTAGRVLEVVEGASQKQVEELWKQLPQGQREAVKAAAMDRGKAMLAGTRAAAAHVSIVHDRFHISQDQNKAVDTVRRQENRALLEQGDVTLKGSRFLWLQGLEKQSDSAFTRFEELVQVNLKTSQAWELKETFQGFWEQPNATEGKVFFTQWHQRAMSSKLEPFMKLAQSLERSLPELLNYFTYRITNAVTEGFNSVIQQIKAAARGFRNFAHYRTRILFFVGNLSLKPT